MKVDLYIHVISGTSKSRLSSGVRDEIYFPVFLYSRFELRSFANNTRVSLGSAILCCLIIFFENGVAISVEKSCEPQI